MSLISRFSFILDIIFYHIQRGIDNPLLTAMSCALQKTLAAILFTTILLESVGGEFEQWCVADPQTPDEDLLAALDWACGPGGTDCSMIQASRPCYLPNTAKDHASFVFNSYYQKFKYRGGSCYFGSAAMVTELDPSHDSCSYEYYP